MIAHTPLFLWWIEPLFSVLKPQSKPVMMLLPHFTCKKLRLREEMCSKSHSQNGKSSRVDLVSKGC